jgi:acyl-CoA thioesterase FadM
VNIPRALESLGGFAHRHELVGMGCWPAMIDLSLYYRKILRVRQGQYASVGTPPAVLRALRVGGRLACVSALEYYERGGGADDGPLHVLVRHGASRLGIRTGDPVIVHWTRREVEGTRLVVSERAARAQAAWCRATRPVSERTQVHMIFRTLIHLLTSRRAPRIGIHDVGRLKLRVVPTDLDILGHMNNGVYLSLMDLGRMDLMIRSGTWSKLRARGFYPVMVNETVTFRKSLQPWQLFDIESRVIGYDDKAVYMQQRFVRDGEIYADAMTRARFLKKSGTVSMAELSEVTGVDVTALAPPVWVAEWAATVALPNTRTPAPSTWE